MTRTSEGQHWYISGRTGMGKSTLIRKIIERKVRFNPHMNVYHIDTKKNPGDFTERDGTVIIGDVAPDAFTTSGNRMVWKPLSDNRKEYDKFFHRILVAGIPAIVNIDECVNMKFGDEIPRELAILALQGRAFGIHVFGSTQEVARSPRQLRSQATHIISFNLKNEYDQSTMLKALELDEKRLGLKKYQFWHLNSDLDLPAKKYNSFEEFLSIVH